MYDLIVIVGGPSGSSACQDVTSDSFSTVTDHFKNSVSIESIC
jgi:hypothetical protein